MRGLCVHLTQKILDDFVACRCDANPLAGWSSDNGTPRSVSATDVLRRSR